MAVGLRPAWRLPRAPRGLAVRVLRVWRSESAKAIPAREQRRSRQAVGQSERREERRL